MAESSGSQVLRALNATNAFSLSLTLRDLLYSTKMEMERQKKLSAVTKFTHIK